VSTIWFLFYFSNQMAIMREALETVVLDKVHDEVWPAMLSLNQVRRFTECSLILHPMFTDSSPNVH
jgi:hypothetical protein